MFQSECGYLFGWVGWLDFTANQPLGYFIVKTFFKFYSFANWEELEGFSCYLLKLAFLLRVWMFQSECGYLFGWVGWLDFTANQPLGYFIVKTFFKFYSFANWEELEGFSCYLLKLAFLLRVWMFQSECGYLFGWVGWLDFTANQPLGYFIVTTFFKFYSFANWEELEGFSCYQLKLAFLLRVWIFKNESRYLLGWVGWLDFMASQPLGFFLY